MNPISIGAGVFCFGTGLTELAMFLKWEHMSALYSSLVCFVFSGVSFGLALM